MAIRQEPGEEPKIGTLKTFAASPSSLLDDVPALIWWVEPTDARERWNKRWYDYTGLPAGLPNGASWQQAIHPDDLAVLLEKRSSDAEIEARVRRADGCYRWFLFRFHAQPTAGADPQTPCAIAIDIDEKKRAHQELTINEQQFRTITDLIPQYIVVISPEGQVLYVNQVALKRTGIQMRDVQEEDSFWRPFHPDDVERVRLQRRLGLASGLPFELEVRVRIDDGQYRWHLVQYNPQKDEADQVIRWYATGTDIDTRKKEEESLRKVNLALQEDVERFSMFDNIVATSEAMRHILHQIGKVAPSDSTVLILGETGTGKEMVARAIHRRSHRSSRIFVRVNCAAIPEALVASELFGHERGAFTGALQRRVGRFEAATGGTIFLDEIGEVPAETQIALLRVLQERELERVGSNHPIAVDVRVITATNRNLQSAIAAGTFRNDLFYRLNVFPIEIPPLRERPQDVAPLIRYFAAFYSQRAGKTIRHIPKRTLDQCRAYRWPGNIRELQNIVERAVILADTDTLAVDEKWFATSAVSAGGRQVRSELAKREIEAIQKALAESHGRISGPSGAATKLGIPRQTLEAKMRKFRIDRYGGSK